MYFDAPYDRKNNFLSNTPCIRLQVMENYPLNSYQMPLRPVMIAIDVKLG